MLASCERPRRGDSVHETSTRPRGSSVEQIFNFVGLGLEFERQVLARGEKLDQVAADAGERIERERVGQLAGADAEARARRAGASAARARRTNRCSWHKPGSRDCRRDIPAGSSSCNPSGSSTRATSTRYPQQANSAEPAGHAIRNGAAPRASGPSAACPRRTDRRRREPDGWNRARRRRSSPPRRRGRGG